MKKIHPIHKFGLLCHIPVLFMAILGKTQVKDAIAYQYL